MRPEQIYKVLEYRKANNGILDELEFSVFIQPLYEKVMGVTAQKTRFIASVNVAAQTTPLDKGEALDLYALSDDEKFRFSEPLVEGALELAEILSPYSEEKEEPIIVENDKVVFKAFNPFLLIPKNALYFIAQNLKQAITYYILSSWYSLADLKTGSNGMGI
ncbi:MAG: hypothetical protein LBG19_01130 [Prevotellaceae bacterium]|jgi:hypothetical protein|nr:hypothetical protein [Prevotellaceae bacterium]